MTAAMMGITQLDLLSGLIEITLLYAKAPVYFLYELPYIAAIIVLKSNVFSLGNNCSVDFYTLNQ